MTTVEEKPQQSADVRFNNEVCCTLIFDEDGNDITDEIMNFITTLETKVREEERKRDLKFLKEMRGYAGTPTDLVNWEMVTKMIDDWIAELSQESED